MDPNAVLAGDLNGDGLVDLIWFKGTFNDSVGHVELAQANGGYASAPNFTIPGTQSVTVPSCATADVTHDGKLDLICAIPDTYTYSVQVVVLPGNGDGSFSAPVTTTFPNQYGQGTILTLVGDLNGDGVPDFILNSNYSPATVLLSDGKGGFLPTKTVPNTYNFSSPVSADINGDGIPDILWPNGAGVALGKGDGSFGGLLTPYPTGVPPVTCAFHDMDGDGKLDAVCGYLASYDNIAGTAFDILHGNGDGTFNPTPIAHQAFGDPSITLSGSGDFFLPVMISDVNGDGIPDVLALSGDGLAVLLGGPGLTFGAPSHYALAFSGYGFLFPGSAQIEFTDLNGDGLVDVLAAGPNGMYLLFGHADGSFGSARAIEVSEVSGHVAVADFNGDGKPDIVSTGAPATSLSLGRGDGTFLPPTAIPGSPFATGSPVFVADFNGDGKADLLSTDASNAYHLMLGNGDGTFAPAVTTTGLAPPFGSQSSSETDTAFLSLTGDLNSDGKADLFSVVDNSLSPTYSLVSALSEGDGTFHSVTTTYPAPAYLSGPFFLSPTAPVLADFAHRGKLDAAYFLNESLYVVRGNGDGSFNATPTMLTTPTVAGIQADGQPALQVADFDGDGNLDIAFLSWYQPMYFYQGGPSCLFIYFGKGDGTFESPTQAGCFTHAYTDLRVADFNGDGRSDIVLQTASALNNYVVGVINNLGNRTFGPEINFTAGSLSGDIFVADLNLDGRPDLVFGNQRYEAGYSANSVTVLVNQTSPVATGTLTSTPDLSYVGQPFKITAKLTPPSVGIVYAGPITFYVDGNIVGSATLAGNVASIVGPTSLAVGRHQLSATWPGDNNDPALSLTGIHTVALVPVNVSLTSSLNPSTVGQSVTFTVQVTAETPPGVTAPIAPFTGVLNLYDGTVLLGTQTSSSGAYSFTTSVLTKGSHFLTASYPGDANFAPGKGTLTQTVEGLSVSMTLTPQPNPAFVGATVNLTAQLAAASNCAVCAFTTEVQFSDGGTLLGQAPVNASGVATFAAIFTSAGLHALSANYSGDSNDQAASATASEQIVRVGTVLTLTSSVNPVAAGTSVTFTARITPNGAAPSLAGALISFSDGAQPFATVAVDASGTATVSASNLAVGTHTITAALSQTAALGASSASLSEVITRAATGITLSGSPNPLYQFQTLTLAVVLTTPAAFPASGTVQLMDDGQALATSAIVSNASTFSTNTLPIGTHTLTAIYAGNPNTLPATSVPLVVTVLPSDFLLKSVPPALTIRTEHHLTFSISAQSIGNFADRLTLSAGQLPDHMRMQFASSTMDLSLGGTGIVSVYMDTDDVMGYAGAAPSQKLTTHTPSALWALVPAPLLMLFTKRRRTRWASFSLFLLGCLTVTLSGCSSLYPKSTVPGTYQIQIQAVGAVTGVRHTLDLQVTVTR